MQNYLPGYLCLYFLYIYIYEHKSIIDGKIHYKLTSLCTTKSLVFWRGPFKGNMGKEEF